ncbi:5'/3'-nucleotidase SurE [Alkalimarinus sediminis]|uniref:5'-nucleotidase SurE n=1 Tax=Alkalimarinus sediminis TaxID=1632866 RepID=A0A9E8HJ53_9ALTE|nr:5'/3'-nucleotidase SurE [Alkalimarinus sediminis]UZW75630.1 5'/3'-nucleotidase SurE [Alkalimarinus sediminis]
MNLLISNDDGVSAPGIIALEKALSQIATVRVSAPDRDHSGASNSLTLDRPLRPTFLENGFASIDGTPTDSVHLGITSLFDLEFERVVSGINSHANLGDDVIYSGTVAAATEGRFLPQPAMAVSLVNQGRNHYQTAAQVVAMLLTSNNNLSVGPRTVLNINVPDIPYDEIRGVQITRLGHRARGGEPELMVDPRGKDRYWIAAAGEGDDAGEGTDFHAVANGYVSITPIHVDMTRYDAISDLSHWIEGMK